MTKLYKQVNTTLGKHSHKITFKKIKKLIKMEGEMMKNIIKRLEAIKTGELIFGGRAFDDELADIIEGLSKQKSAGTLDDPLALAILFHHTYERLALGHDYITREGTRIFNPESKNGKLMVATCTEIIKMIKEEN
jgi:hypothetical protein